MILLRAGWSSLSPCDNPFDSESPLPRNASPKILQITMRPIVASFNTRPCQSNGGAVVFHVIYQDVLVCWSFTGGSIVTKIIVIDVVILTLHVPENLPDKEGAAVRKTLKSPKFMTHLRAAIRAVIRQSPKLASVAPTLSR